MSLSLRGFCLDALSAIKPRSVERCSDSIYELWRPQRSREPAMLSVLVASPEICASTNSCLWALQPVPSSPFSLWCGSSDVVISVNSCVSQSCPISWFHHSWTTGPPELQLYNDQQKWDTCAKSIQAKDLWWLMLMWYLSFCYCRIVLNFVIMGHRVINWKVTILLLTQVTM